jgi:hypothetical protein
MTTYVDTAKLFQYFCLLYLGLGAVCFLCDCACDIQQDDLIAPRSAPGLKAPKKLWWAKEITPDLHVAGGLREMALESLFTASTDAHSPSSSKTASY